MSHIYAWQVGGSMAIECPDWEGDWFVEHQNEVDAIYCPGCGARIKPEVAE